MLKGKLLLVEMMKSIVQQNLSSHKAIFTLMLNKFEHHVHLNIDAKSRKGDIKLIRGFKLGV
jgi:hypothetical protein